MTIAVVEISRKSGQLGSGDSVIHIVLAYILIRAFNDGLCGVHLLKLNSVGDVSGKEPGASGVDELVVI